MNKKLVIVWVVGIILLIGIGIFGYLNKDLSLDNEEYKPVVDYNKKTCTITTADTSIIYNFKLDQDKDIEKLTITYYDTSKNISRYDAVTRLSNMSNQVVTSSLQGDITEFKLITNIDYTNFAQNYISGMENSFTSLGIHIFDTKDYATYSNNVKNTSSGSTIKCD